MNKTNQPILRVEGLKTYFDVKKGRMGKTIGQVKAVDDVTLEIAKGETLGVVGESGCGKSTIGKTILRGIEATDGKVFFDLGDNGELTEITKLSNKELKKNGFRKSTQMIFQDPNSSLDPRMTILDIITEPLVINGAKKDAKLQARAEELMTIVGLDPKYLKRYPHAFSGGQRQRISIARALATQPRFIIADEPTSALDVSIQAQILNLLTELQNKYDITYLFVSHNLGVIRYICDRVAVMYLGQMIENAPNKNLFENPLHPYTEALLKSVPLANPKMKSGLESAPGEIGNPMNIPKGCRFSTRCQYATEVCIQECPTLRELSENHFVACHHAENLKLKGIG